VNCDLFGPQLSLALGLKSMLTKLQKFVGISEIFFGFLGLIFLLPTWANNPINLSMWYFIFTGIALFLSLLAGFLLIRKNKLGLYLSIIVQGVQIVQIGWNNSIYKYEAGLQLLISLTSQQFGIKPGFNVGAWFGTFPASIQPYLAINIVALIFFIYLLKGLNSFASINYLAQQNAPADR
jgi:hypothetical protein